jgi:hypothetical protein
MIIGTLAFFTILLGFTFSEAVIFTVSPLLGILTNLVILIATVWIMNEKVEWVFWVLIALCLGVSIISCLGLLGSGFWAVVAIIAYHSLLASAIWYMVTCPYRH